MKTAVVSRLLASVLAAALASTSAAALEPAPGPSARLVLDGPIHPGSDRTVTGSGAPDLPGIFVELWRRVRGSARAESVASAAVEEGGVFAFEGVEVGDGDRFHVTLSRSWNFDNDGDFEGWDKVISWDSLPEVAGGVMRMRIADGNFDGVRDPFVMTNFDYNPSFYRVVEIRLRNHAQMASANMAVYWGSPWAERISFHRSRVPVDMAGFQTLMIPLGLDEVRVNPPPVERGVDGLWHQGSLNDALRIDPIDGLLPGDESLDGTLIEIDWIRIREDFRMDFEADGDFACISSAVDVAAIDVVDGFLTYRSAGNPEIGCDLEVGLLDTSYFAQIVLGMENDELAIARGELRLRFNDADSAGSYVDDDGSAQEAALPVNLPGRTDVVAGLDLMTQPQGEWSEDGRVPVAGLRLALPRLQSAAEEVRIDYLGFTRADPFGPSEAETAAPPNVPPQAVIATRPAPPVVELRGASVELILDGAGSNDGDGGSQGLAFLWEKVSGPAGDRLNAAGSAVTSVACSRLGSYVYRLTVDDGADYDAVDSAEVVVEVVEPEPEPEPEPGIRFLRGDVNGDGRSMEMADAVCIFQHVAAELSHRVRARPLACADAADVNDNGKVELRDGIAILRFLFMGSNMPSELFASCQVDLTEDKLPECVYPEDLCEARSPAPRRPAPKGPNSPDRNRRCPEKRDHDERGGRGR
jgi:hypothetical protein